MNDEMTVGELAAKLDGLDVAVGQHIVRVTCGTWNVAKSYESFRELLEILPGMADEARAKEEAIAVEPDAVERTRESAFDRCERMRGRRRNND